MRRDVRSDFEDDLGVPGEGDRGRRSARQGRPSTNTATWVPAGALNDVSLVRESGSPHERNRSAA